MQNLKDVITLTKDIRVLYVEDNDKARGSMLNIFREFFDTIVVAVDGEDGLEKFQENSIDLVISDISMPKMNGLEMLEKIQEINQDIRIILLSAHNDIDYFKRALDMSVEAYIFKPIELEKFIKTLYSIVEKIDLQKKLLRNVDFLEQYQKATDESAIVSKTDVNGFITHVNDQFCTLCEYTREELLGANQNIIRHPDNSPELFAQLWDVIKEKKQTWRGVLRNITKSGKTYYVDAMIKPLFNAEGEVMEYIAIRHDITTVMNQKKQMRDFIRGASKPFMSLIQIENFDDIFKYYGEEISQEIAFKLETFLRNFFLKEFPQSSLFTLSEGEYAVVHDDKEFVDDALISQRIKRLKEMQTTINDFTINVRDISYDISVLLVVSFEKDIYDDAKHGMRQLLEQNQTFLVANSLAQKMNIASQKNLDMLLKVKSAISDKRIVSYFQPIVDGNAEIVKYESLVRLIDEDAKVLSPFFFLDIAKRAKYYTQITSRVLVNSFEALAFTTKNISINLSAIDIEKQSISEEIFTLLERYKSDAHRVVFELLEDEDVKDFDLIKNFIKDVKSYGVKIAIDDFGSGYSNYERLLDYQPDIIKIDGSLVKNIVSSEFSVSVIQSIILFAKSNGVEIIAEYVENEAIFMKLKDMGIDYFQGYFFGKPDILVEK